jgi:hypothetical protein
MEQEVCFAQHRQQGMVTGTPMLARVMSFERSFLLSVALEHRRIQVQPSRRGGRRSICHSAKGSNTRCTCPISKPPKQIADSVIDGKALQTQQCMQRAIATQHTGVSKTFGSYHHGHQKGHKGVRGIDVIRRFPVHRHVLPELLHQADLAQKREKDCQPSKGRYCTLRCILLFGN